MSHVNKLKGAEGTLNQAREPSVTKYLDELEHRTFTDEKVEAYFRPIREMYADQYRVFVLGQWGEK